MRSSRPGRAYAPIPPSCRPHRTQPCFVGRSRWQDRHRGARSRARGASGSPLSSQRGTRFRAAAHSCIGRLKKASVQLPFPSNQISEAMPGLMATHRRSSEEIPCLATSSPHGHSAHVSQVTAVRMLKPRVPRIEWSGVACVVNADSQSKLGCAFGPPETGVPSLGSFRFSGRHTA